METDESFAWPDEWERALPAVEQMVRGICRRFRLSESDAEEIDAAVKEAFWLQTLRFAKVGEPNFADMAGVMGWAGTTATRLIIRAWRRRGRLAEIGGLDLANFAGREKSHIGVEDLLGEVRDDRKREAVRCVLLDGYTLKEVANRLGVKTTTAFNLYHAGLQEIRERVADGGQ